jgi:hypothetical protein
VISANPVSVKGGLLTIVGNNFGSDVSCGTRKRERGVVTERRGEREEERKRNRDRGTEGEEGEGRG